MAKKAQKGKAKVGKAGQRRVGKKISHLAKTEPTMSQEQRVAMALSMEREKRLTEKGAYKPVKKKGKKKAGKKK